MMIRGTSTTKVICICISKLEYHQYAIVASLKELQKEKNIVVVGELQEGCEGLECNFSG